MNSEYDVAFSFAGEDRDYVESVANYLTYQGVTFFYDRFEEDRLWGEDLYVHLDEVYRKSAQFCVIFISKAYANKLWTNHERKSAQARDFINNNESYILPARFDDTEIKGLLPTIGFVDLKNKAPYEFAELIALKVRGRRNQRLRVALSEALRLSEDYLKPHSLVASDILADEIRNAFRKTGYSPDLELLKPYLESDSPEERTVGYISYQTGPSMMIGDLLYSSLDKELKFAETASETRPMWQLLIAIALFATVTDAEEIQFLDFDLGPALSLLESLTSVDVGGQCKMKLRGLMNIYPWMRGRRGNHCGMNYSYEESRHFAWSNGENTYSYKGALAFVKLYPEVALYHISQGHFLNWYSISVPSSSTVLDLAFTIADEMVREVSKE